jgi:hypothetical protein
MTKILKQVCEKNNYDYKKVSSVIDKTSIDISSFQVEEIEKLIDYIDNNLAEFNIDTIKLDNSKVKQETKQEVKKNINEVKEVEKEETKFPLTIRDICILTKKNYIEVLKIAFDLFGTKQPKRRNGLFYYDEVHYNLICDYITNGKTTKKEIIVEKNIEQEKDTLEKVDTQLKEIINLNNQIVQKTKQALKTQEKYYLNRIDYLKKQLKEKDNNIIVEKNKSKELELAGKNRARFNTLWATFEKQMKQDCLGKIPKEYANYINHYYTIFQRQHFFNDVKINKEWLNKQPNKVKYIQELLDIYNSEKFRHS